MKVTRIVMFVFAAALCAAFGGNANAQCVMSLDGNRPVFNGNFASRPAFQEMSRASHKEVDTFAAEPTVVGLWDVKFIADNVVVDEGFDQYHADGTEILNDTPPPATGNVCLGVYKTPASRSIKLKHPSWIYDQSNTTVIGVATILEQITLDPGGNSFRGTFTVQLRDLNGNPLGPDLFGDLQGTRITP